jgi:hypothetical protein
MKCVLSLTTTPTRIDHVNHLLSITPDLECFDEIHINVPRIFKRTSSPYEIPKNIERHVHIVDDDLGPATKIVHTIERLKNPDDIVVSIDDDNLLPQGLLKKLIEQCKLHDCVITGLGKYLRYWNLPRMRPFPMKLASSKYVDLIEGWSGVAYRKKHVDPAWVRRIIQNSCTECFVSDDLVLSAAIHLKGYSIQTLSSSHPRRQNQLARAIGELPWSHGPDAIHLGAGSSKTYEGHERNCVDAHYDNYKCCLDQIARLATNMPKQ